MKTEFENSMRRLSFLCRLLDGYQNCLNKSLPATLSATNHFLSMEYLDK